MYKNIFVNFTKSIKWNKIIQLQILDQTLDNIKIYIVYKLYHIIIKILKYQTLCNQVILLDTSIKSQDIGELPWQVGIHEYENCEKNYFIRVTYLFIYYFTF